MPINKLHAFLVRSSSRITLTFPVWYFRFLHRLHSTIMGQTVKSNGLARLEDVEKHYNVFLLEFEDGCFSRKIKPLL